MAVVRWNRLYTLGVGLVALACGDGGGGTQPPGPPTDLFISGGNGQSWYFNNPLPLPLSVTAKDASGRAVPGVVVTWALTSGTGAVRPTQSTTDANGIATTIDSIGSSTLQTVGATFTGLASAASFTEAATTPPTSAAVDVKDNFFSPQNVVMQTGGTVTWTWQGAAVHNITYTGGPMPLPADGPNQTTGTFSSKITVVGKYTYVCTNHAGMTGSITVVH